MNPNHFLAVAISYLFGRPARLAREAAVGKTLVSSSLIDRVAAGLGRRWSRCRSASSGSCPGCSTARSASAARSPPARRSCAATARLDDGQGRHPAGAARLGDPGRDRAHAVSSTTRELTAQYGDSGLRPRRRAGRPREQKAALGKLSPDDVTATELAGEPITAKLTQAPGNDARSAASR